MKILATIAIAFLLTSCGGGIATRSAGNINIQAKAGNDVIIRLAGNDATQAAEKTQSIAAQAEATVDRTAVGGNDAAVSAETPPASEQPQSVSEKEILSSEKTENTVAKKPVAKPAK